MLSENVIISTGTEFIENEEVSKQDYELNAAKRLLERIKKEQEVICKILKLA